MGDQETAVCFSAPLELEGCGRPGGFMTMKTLRTLSNTLLLLWVAAIAYSVWLHDWALYLGTGLALIYLFVWALCRAAALADKELQ